MLVTSSFLSGSYKCVRRWNGGPSSRLSCPQPHSTQTGWFTVQEGPCDVCTDTAHVPLSSKQTQGSECFPHLPPFRSTCLDPGSGLCFWESSAEPDISRWALHPRVTVLTCGSLLTGPGGGTSSLWIQMSFPTIPSNTRRTAHVTHPVQLFC